MAEEIESEDKPVSDRLSQYPESVQQILRRTPEEKAARVYEVMREAKIMSVENLFAAGFYSTQELNNVTWEMLQDPNLSEEQRRRVQALRDSALK